MDYLETFSPVIRYDSVRVLLAIAAEKDLEIQQCDAKSRFLNGDLEQDIYMEVPNLVSVGSVRSYVKSLYGLKQASRCCNTKFVCIFDAIPFKRNKCRLMRILQFS